MLKTRQPSPLRSLQADEFLPPVSGWTTLAGAILIGAVGTAIALASVMTYRITVKAPASVRPAGDLRVVQATIGGRVNRIDVQVNDPVQQGEAIATLDRTPLETQQRQLQGTYHQQQIQLAQVTSQIQLMTSQIASESRAIAQAVSAAQAELAQNQRQYQERQVVTQADLSEAEAALTLAQSEMQRYQTLVASGAVSQLQLDEKQAAVQAAEAQIQRTRAALNPTNSPVAIAQQQVAQEASRGRATLATLQREQELLVQNQAELQAQMIQTQQALQQIEAELEQTTVRATHTGVIFQLNLRNPNQVVQPGDVIAEIAPVTPQLVLKARVATQDIDLVEPGQTVQLRIAACPFPDYGTLRGTVSAVAPDAVIPTGDRLGAGTPYFDVTIQPEAIALAGSRRQCQLQPGMDAEANIISREETFLQFLLRRVRLLSSA